MFRSAKHGVPVSTAPKGEEEGQKPGKITENGLVICNASLSRWTDAFRKGERKCHFLILKMFLNYEIY